VRLFVAIIVNAGGGVVEKNSYAAAHCSHNAVLEGGRSSYQYEDIGEKPQIVVPGKCSPLLLSCSRLLQLG
jgi:hypothetical protein